LVRPRARRGDEGLEPRRARGHAGDRRRGRPRHRRRPERSGDDPVGRTRCGDGPSASRGPARRRRRHRRREPAGRGAGNREVVPDRPRPDPPDGDAPLNPPLAGRFRRTAGIPGRVAPSDSPAPFPSSPSSSASSSAPPSSGLTSAPSPVPAVVVAGTHSGAGKTTITAVLARELRRRGLTVQPFKIGPDFIDPGYHGEAAGRRSINLDLWMMGEEGVRRSFARWSRGADIAVIEAMGAVFDGADGTGEGSAAHLAGILGVPLLVVVDVWGMTRTTGAILQGLLGFDPDTTIVGCILNRVGSAKHAQMIRDSLPPELERLVLGAVPYRRALEIPER